MKLRTELRYIDTPAGKMKLILLRPEKSEAPVPGILWIHGGGYMTGMASMVHFSEGRMLAQKYGAVVVSPAYRLAWRAPYPAALEDCYAALRYLHEHADELSVRRDKLVVGGESAGGGLAAAVCLYARDRGEVDVAFQIPLYPMLDCEDTPSSRDNHGYGWDTRRNHWGWSHYLGSLYHTSHVPPYASASRAEDYRGLPPGYTFVQDGEPFYDETLTYIRRLNESGAASRVDVFHGKLHGFDALFWTKKSRLARQRLCAAYEQAILEDRQGD